MAQTIREFESYQLEVLGLKEVRWTGSGKIRNGDTTLLHSGPENNHERGVGDMLSKEESKALIG